MPKQMHWSPNGLESPAVDLRDREGASVRLRLLEREDGPALDRFIREGLSDASRRRFGAHKPEASSSDICRAIGRDNTIRIVAEHDAAIVGYLILDGNIPADEQRRYSTHSYPEAVGANGVRLAPAIADAFQSRGLGTALLRYALSLAHHVGITHIILWGGTHDDNVKGRALYERVGFQYVGTFEKERPGVALMNHDMALDVRQVIQEDPTIVRIAERTRSPFDGPSIS